MILPFDHDRWVMFGAEVLVEDRFPGTGIAWRRARYLRPYEGGTHVWVLLDDDLNGESPEVVARERVHLLHGPRQWIPIEDLDGGCEPDEAGVQRSARRREKQRR